MINKIRIRDSLKSRIILHVGYAIRRWHNWFNLQNLSVRAFMKNSVILNALIGKINLIVVHFTHFTVEPCNEILTYIPINSIQTYLFSVQNNIIIIGMNRFIKLWI